MAVDNKNFNIDFNFTNLTEGEEATLLQTLLMV